MINIILFKNIKIFNIKIFNKNKNIIIKFVYNYILMNKVFIRQNVTLFAIIIFTISFSLIQYIKPGFLFNSDGSVREFGVGYRNKTIMPLWLMSIILGILSYLFVLYYLSTPDPIF